MSMSCTSQCIKYLLFVFNFIFAVCGLGILAFGVVIHLHMVNVNDHLDINLTFPSITFIVVGSIIFIISFFGCCGAIRESHCMTVTFASFLLFIFLLQVAVAGYAFVVVKNSSEGDIMSSYRKIFDTYFVDAKNREIIDQIQSNLQCCGVSSYHDFDDRGSIPASCCWNAVENTCSAENTFSEGCVPKIKNALMTLGTAFGSVAVVVAAVELIGIIFALCLANSIKNAERRGYRV